MNMKDIVEKSKAICEKSKCTSCMLKECACIDTHGRVNACDENDLIALEKNLEKIGINEKKGKSKK